MENGTPLMRDYLTFDETSNQLGLNDRILSFSTSMGAKIRDFTVLIKATVPADSDG